MSLSQERMERKGSTKERTIQKCMVISDRARRLREGVRLYLPQYKNPITVPRQLSITQMEQGAIEWGDIKAMETILNNDPQGIIPMWFILLKLSQKQSLSYQNQKVQSKIKKMQDLMLSLAKDAEVLLPEVAIQSEEMPSRVLYLNPQDINRSFKMYRWKTLNLRTWHWGSTN